MKGQIQTIKEFCAKPRFFMVKFESKGDEEFGKILKKEEIGGVDLKKNEIHRSIEYENGNMLFVLDLKPQQKGQFVDNPLQLLIKNLEEARAIEMVYPGIFRWAFNGVNIKAYAIVPSGTKKANTTLTRYGGTENFIKILRKHLRNIGKMGHGEAPDYNLLDVNEDLEETELSIGSINLFNKLYSVGIKPSMNYTDIIKNSKNNIQVWSPINVLDMKYWAREINPDFITEAKHIKLKDAIPTDGAFDLYPPCIKAIMSMKNKGNRLRFLLARFLLSTHKPSDAKFIYYCVLGDEEKQHVKKGNCSLQWNYIMNNMKRYGCPSCRELQMFCDRSCELTHPLEKIQTYLENQEENAD